MLGAYVPVLATPGARPRYLAMFLSALPLGMLTLAIVLCVQDWTGSLRAAGTISGVFGLGNAIGLSLQGPMMDRWGARRVVLIVGTLCTVSLLAFALLGELSGGPIGALAALALIGGVTIPAITAAVRSWLPTALRDPQRREASYALLSAMFQGAVTIGPVLVTASLLLGGPTPAIMLAAVLVLSATLLYGSTGQGEAPGTGVLLPDGSENTSVEASGALLDGRAPMVLDRRGLTVPDRFHLTPGLLTVLVTVALDGIAVGITAVAVPGLMEGAGVAALAGVAFSAMALGEVISALGFGARTWPGDRALQLSAVQGALAIVAVLIHLVAASPWLLVTVMFCAGLTGAPGSILRSGLLDVVSSSSAIARSYSMLVAVGLVAGAAGNMLAGHLATPMGTEDLLWLPVLALSAAAIWTLLRRLTLRPIG